MVSQLTIEDLKNIEKILHPMFRGILTAHLQPLEKKIDRIIATLEKSIATFEHQQQHTQKFIATQV